MSHLAVTDDLFFSRAGLDQNRVEAQVNQALKGADDGELFLEYRLSESLAYDDGRLKNASFDTLQGLGLRSIAGEAAGYAHSSELSEAAIGRSAEAIRAVHSGHGGVMADTPGGTNQLLYSDDNPLGSAPFEVKVKLLEEINSYARGKDERVRQVSASISGEWQAVQIIRSGGQRSADIRPLVRLNVSVVVGKDDRLESGNFGGGGRFSYEALFEERYWKAAVDEALRMALVNLDSIAAPAGEMQVVLGAGWPGILLHEAVGHGLEGDFNRKKTSAFSGLLGEQVASKGVTVVDDGTLADRRGSLTIDDEGTPSQYTTLIEDGRLVGYMQDRQNARLMNMLATGNGRRQSYAHIPMPRMTNTYMLGGEDSPEEILKSVKKEALRRTVWRRSSGHHLGQVRVLLHGSLSGRRRQDRRASEGCHPNRQWAGDHDQGLARRQRHGARYRHRHLRQGWPRRPRRSRPADHADRGSDRRRHSSLEQHGGLERLCSDGFDFHQPVGLGKT